MEVKLTFKFPSSSSAMLLLVMIIAIVSMPAVLGQSRYHYNVEKPGSCPPQLNVEICSRSCFSDAYCQGIGKCCPTSCGGFVCSRPVTMKRPTQTQKPGTCPNPPTGRWVCSSTCTDDGDCRGTTKCCKNRCGAMTCQKPDIEVIESVELPVIPIGNNPYENNPFDRNPFLSPTYVVNNN